MIHQDDPTELTEADIIETILDEEDQVADLRTRYEIVELAEARVPPPRSSSWSNAVGALIRLRQGALGKGDTELAERAEAAIGALYGIQKFVEAEEANREEADPFPPSETSTRHTLIGLGRR
jgi:hypothetical protein